MKPEEVGYTTELDRDYAKELRSVCDGASLAEFVSRWGYWLDDSAQKLTAADWPGIAPLLEDCRTEGVEPEERHTIAINLLMPEKIIKISMAANHFGVPWGCAYIRMKEEKMIKY